MPSFSNSRVFQRVEALWFSNRAMLSVHRNSFQSDAAPPPPAAAVASTGVPSASEPCARAR